MKFTRPIIAVALTLLAGTAFAQSHNHNHAPAAKAATPSQNAHQNANEHARFKAEFVSYDKNNDGQLSRREMAKHPMLGHFKMMDLNGDGYISFAEYTRKH